MILVRDIKAVTFDVGGTLIRPWPSVGHVYAEVASRHGCANVAAETLNTHFATAWRAKKNFDHSRRAWLDLVEKTFAGLVDQGVVKEFFNDLYDRFSHPQAWQVFDDVYPTLDALGKRQLRLGIISNWDERLRPLLDRLKLSPCFDVTVISVEAGFAKPAKEIFERAVEMLGVPSRSILHVGYSPEEDITGAHLAGLQGLLLDRKGSDRVVGSIHTLEALKATEPSAFGPP